MRECLIALLVILVTVLTTGVGYTGPLGLYGFLTVPTGDFGSKTDDNGGLAKTGFALGTEIELLELPIEAPGFFWISDAMVVFNSFDTDAMVDIMGGGTVDAGWWVNVPVLTGLRFEAPAAPQVKLYGAGLVGANFSRSPKLDWSGVVFDGVNYHDVILTQESGSGASFAFELGGGLLIREMLDVSMRYLNLGKPHFDVDTRVTIDGYPQSGSGKFDQSISMFVVSAGVRF